MLELSPACPGPTYSHIVHSSGGLCPVATQLNYITDLVFRVKGRIS